MPKLATNLSEEFTRRLVSFEHSRKNIERLFTTQGIVRRDVHLFYEGVFLKTVTSFEGFLEDLFIDHLAGNIMPGRGIEPRVNFRSTVMARKVVCGGRPYADWLPFAHTKKRSTAYFKNGLPFTRLTKDEVSSLDRMITIRHAVAHQSGSASRKFAKEVLGTTNRLPIEKTPAGFLRSSIGINPPRTQYEDIAGTLAMLSRKLTA